MTVRRIYDAWNGEGLAGVETYMSHDVEWVNPDYAVEPGTRRGHQGLAAVVQAVDAAFAEYRHEPDELIEAGDKVLVFVTFWARGRDSGVELHVEEQHVWTFENVKVTRVEWFHNLGDALEAAGLAN